MFLETVRSEGLGCLSYIFGDGGKAAVIDPRRDCKVYVDIANRHGAQITHIFETHRNEDFVIGSLELARRTGAKIYHGAALPFKYGENVKDGDKFTLGKIALNILETPGHTPESISITLSDAGFSEKPIAVFTGDALFIGDTGRTDFYEDRKEELAGELYDSIHKKLLPLGDHVILYPAHGAGSVCGANLAEREFSTLGFERQFSPLLQKSREDFIAHKVNEEHYYAPYFKQMEKFNQGGIPLKTKLPEPKPVSAHDFDAAIREEHMLVVDIRSPEAFAGAHIPGSLSIPLNMLSAFAGWFLPYDSPIGLVAENKNDVEQARIYLMRIGFDNVTRYLEGGLHAWEVGGFEFERVPAVSIGALKKRVEAKEDLLVLDVRSHSEYEAMPSQHSKHMYLGELPHHIKDIPRNRKIVTLCASGRRAVIAASLLQQSGFKDVEVCFGSMAACSVPDVKTDHVPQAA